MASCKLPCELLRMDVQGDMPRIMPTRVARTVLTTVDKAYPFPRGFRKDSICAIHEHQLTGDGEV